ncbi:MAG: NAD(+)/NADH kinase [bacterium]
MKAMNSSYKIKSLNNKILTLGKIGIIYNIEHNKAVEVVEKLENILNTYGLYCVKKLITPGKHENFDKDIDLSIVVGGDGTFLGAARYYAPLNIPLFGINIGRLGFLAQLNPENMESGIQKLIDGKFKIEERLMIKASNNQENPDFYNTALNDIVIKGGSISRTAQLFLYINNKHVCDYVADGLIVSTPTGSTAYTLSAGGPVVMPELEAMVIVPICPHSLTTRPIVIPADEKIMVKIKTDSDSIYLTADGQENIKIKSSDNIYIKQNEHKAKLILLEKENNGFYGILREKLHWGVVPGI